MQGFFTSLRFADAVRGLLAGAAPAPTAPARAGTRAAPAPLRAVDAGAPAAAGPATRPSRAPLEASVATEARPAAPAPTVAEALPATLVVEPRVPVAAKHLVDPVGLRVVPYRPVTRWPLRRAAPRVLDPFRGFPKRSLVLAELMYGPRDRA